MSEFSSVRTSRVQSIAAKSIVSSHACTSQMSRVSSKASSVAGSKITGFSKASSHLTELLQEKLFVDEYGFTDKTCRNCMNQLSIDEIIALAVPLDANGMPVCKIEEINFDEMTFICLSCYAE